MDRIKKAYFRFTSGLVAILSSEAIDCSLWPTFVAELSKIWPVSERQRNMHKKIRSLAENSTPFAVLFYKDNKKVNHNFVRVTRPCRKRKCKSKDDESCAAEICLHPNG